MGAPVDRLHSMGFSTGASQVPLFGERCPPRTSPVNNAIVRTLAYFTTNVALFLEVDKYFHGPRARGRGCRSPLVAHPEQLGAGGCASWI
jgi:hypothetical protein